ncbi:dynein axonemal assembly factor 5-like [Lineus longissimus]|uniref:dynein axonemal assembly factor 5-like n=1 Tax=Lineus longissimus TaxID=88925 RepID=UPI00315C98EF
MADGMNTTVEAILQSNARHINCLSEDNRSTRKRAIEGIRKETLGLNPKPSKEILQEVFQQILKPLLKCMSDPVEKNRELSCALVSDFLQNIPQPVDSLPYIVPLLVQRLGQQEIIEASEEIRLDLVRLLGLIIGFAGKNNSVYLDDMMKILQRTIVDPYPEVKKESCKCAAVVAKLVPEHFHMQSESLIKPLLQTLSHQHSRVRSCVIETIGSVIQYGNGKSVDDVVSHLAQRLFDQAPMVRKAVTTVVGNWLLELPDRYSFWHKLIPLLLTSMSDELPEIQQLADALWHDIGIRFEHENEEDLKEKLDFIRADPEHYPAGVERPNLGCRTLMFRNISKILPALVRDLSDWVVGTRIKCSALLYHLVLNNEDYVTQHMEVLLNGLYKGCGDEEKEVVMNTVKAAELVGYFVEPEVWCKLVLPAVKTHQNYNTLMVLAAIIKGCQKAKIQPFIQVIAATISVPDVSQTNQANVQLQLIDCVDSLTTIAGEMCKPESMQLFTVLITVLALQAGDVIKERAHASLQKLAVVQGLSEVQNLYALHAKTLLERWSDDYPMWNIHSIDRQIFDALLIDSGPVVGELLDIIVPMFTANLKTEKDAEVRLKFFSLLSRLIMNAPQSVDSQNRFADFAVVVVRDMILPNCVWHAGRVAGAIRTTAISCLWAILQSGVLDKEKLITILPELVTQLLTLMDDDNKSTRLVACRVLTRIFNAVGTAIDQHRLHNLYPELLKRLDDSSDDIRVAVSKTFTAYFQCFDTGFDVGLYSAHLEAIYKGLLVHLDDPDPKIQESILDVLKEAAKIKPALLSTEIDSVKHKHRTSKYCDSLTDFMKTLSVQ